MIILKCILLIIVIPIALGLFAIRFKKEKNNPFLAFVIGYIIQFASFELIYVPMYFAKMSFQVVLYTWSTFILILSIISLIINRKRFKKIMKQTVEMIKNAPKMLTIIFCLFLALQIVVPMLYTQKIDPDDAFYLATINTTIETNSLFEYNAYDGSRYAGRPLRYSLSGLQIYFATLSQILNIHPAILIHTIWPSIIIPLEFVLYGLIGKRLFNNHKEKTMYFLIFLSMIYMFGAFSVYTNFSFFAYRSWQGKALIGNFVLPMIWLCYFYCTQNDQWGDWLLLLCTMITACFVTEIGVFLAPFALGILAILDAIQNKKIKNLFKFGSCCLPQLIIGILYLIGV